MPFIIIRREMTQPIDGEPTIEEVAYFLLPPKGAGLTIKSYGEVLDNLDILSLSEKGMEEVLIRLWCPTCKFPLIEGHNIYGDQRWFCMKCRKPFFRYGYNGPLCENDSGR